MTAPHAGHATTRLSRTINSIQYFTVAFGCVVGVGWVIVLGGLVAQAGPGGAALAIATGGLGILLVAFCYAEVAGMRPAGFSDRNQIPGPAGRTAPAVNTGQAPPHLRPGPPAAVPA